VSLFEEIALNDYPEAYGGMNLDLFYTVVFLEELQKIKSSGYC
jgi:alkylation response protein AidB-like acyl-CoA dehydrogenase